MPRVRLLISSTSDARQRFGSEVTKLTTPFWALASLARLQGCCMHKCETEGISTPQTPNIELSTACGYSPQCNLSCSELQSVMVIP